MTLQTEESSNRATADSGFPSRVDVAMLTIAHSAVDDRIFHREARALAARRLSVCVIGPHPQSEVLNNISIQALPKSRSRSSRLLLGWTLLKKAFEIRAKLYIFHDPELFPAALALKLLGRKVVYDAHENLPAQFLQKDWIPKAIRILAKPLIAAIEALVAKCMDGVITVNRTLQSRFAKKKSIVVRNLPPEEVLEILSEGPPISSRKPVVIYAGALSRIRGIQELVRAFDHIPAEEAELWLIGHFVDPEFEASILGDARQNVKWLGQKEFYEVIRLYNSAKIGALLHFPAPNHVGAIPVKLFEYLAAGLPVVASDMPEYTELLEGCGIQVNAHNVKEIAAAIRKLLANEDEIERMSEAGKNKMYRSMRWETDAHELTVFCSSLIWS